MAEPGMKKNDLVAEIYHAGVQGSPRVIMETMPHLFLLIGAGEEAAACHMTWNDEPLKNNEGMFLELGGAYARYHCPCSRTLFLGAPPQQYLRY